MHGAMPGRPEPRYAMYRSRRRAVTVEALTRSWQSRTKRDPMRRPHSRPVRVTSESRQDVSVDLDLDDSIGQ